MHCEAVHAGTDLNTKLSIYIYILIQMYTIQIQIIQIHFSKSKIYLQFVEALLRIYSIRTEESSMFLKNGSFKVVEIIFFL